MMLLFKSDFLIILICYSNFLSFRSKAEAPVAAVPAEVEEADEDGDDNVDG